MAEIFGYQAIFDTLPVAIYTTDADGVITHYNRAAADLAGRAPEIGKDKWCVTWRLYRPDGSVLPHDECPMALTLKGRRAVRGEQAIAERPDGTRVPFLAHPTPLFDDAGKLVGAVNMLIDLSEAKRAEAALLRQTARSEKLNSVAKVLSGDLDVERVLQTVIDTATELAGARFGAFIYKTEEGSGDRYRFHKVSSAAGLQPETLAGAFGSPFVEPALHGVAISSDDIRNDRHFAGMQSPRILGHEIVSYLGVPVIGRSGEVRGALLFGHDQPGAFTHETEDFVVGIAAHAAIAIDNAELLKAANIEIERRRQAEQAQDFLAAIVTSSGDAIISKDLNGIIATWNQAAERLFGYTAGEIVGKPVHLLIPDEHQDEEPRILERIRRGERIEHFETIRRRKDGSLVDISLTVSPVSDRTGRIVGASKIARDISERKRAEEAMVRRLAEQVALYRFTDRLYRATSLPEIYDAALDTILAALHCDRSSLLLFDEEGVMRFVGSRGLSETYRSAVEGHSPWKPGDRDPQPIFVRDIEESTEADWLKATVRRESIRAIGFIPLTVNGAVIGKFMTYYDRPHSFTDDETALAMTIARQLGFSIDRKRVADGRRAAEDALHRERELLQTILDRIPAMVTIHEPESAERRVNAEFERVLGWGFEEAFDALVRAGQSDPEYRQSLERFGETGKPGWRDIRLRAKDGRDVESTWANVRLFDGTEVGIGIDIGERKRGERQRELLVAELSHRVKNTLATVMSVAQQSFSKNVTMEQARRSFEGRILALAQTHSRLAETNWSGVPLEAVLLDELAPYRKEDGGNVAISGAPVALNSRSAVSLGMAFHELATNAAKYGALSVGAGRVVADWHIDPQDRQLRVHWREIGGPPVKAPDRRGFGRLLLERALVSDLKGSVDMRFTEAGLDCTISLPIDDNVITTA